jgi:transposase
MTNPPVPDDLSREDLWALVLQLQTELTQAQERIAELEAQLAKPKKTARNSSVPPSQSAKGKQQQRRKRRGAKPGHKGVSRANGEPDQVVECRAGVCTHCGADLSEAEHELIARHQVVELPPVKPVIIELRRYQVRCECGHCMAGRYPAGYDEPAQTFGPRVHALLSYLNGTHHIAQERLKRLMNEVCGLAISAGAIANSLQRTARRLEKPAHDILRDIRRSKVIGSDETGFRVEGENWWLWTVQTPQASYFAAADTRAGEVLEALLFDAVAEVWCSDLYSAQLTAPARRFAICHAHQLRDLQYAIDAGDDRYAPAMQWLLREALHLSRCRENLLPETYKAHLEAVKATCLALLDLPTDHPDALRLQKRYRKHHEKLWVFLERDDVPFDNNASERALRPAVIHRKVTGGFRTEAGVVAYALYRTIEDTARKRGQSIFDALFNVLGRPIAPHTVSFSSL